MRQSSAAGWCRAANCSRFRTYVLTFGDL
jgi:hypothetical protein